VAGTEMGDIIPSYPTLLIFSPLRYATQRRNIIHSLKTKAASTTAAHTVPATAQSPIPVQQPKLCNRRPCRRVVLFIINRVVLINKLTLINRVNRVGDPEN